MTEKSEEKNRETSLWAFQQGKSLHKTMLNMMNYNNNNSENAYEQHITIKLCSDI